MKRNKHDVAGEQPLTSTTRGMSAWQARHTGQRVAIAEFPEIRIISNLRLTDTVHKYNTTNKTKEPARDDEVYCSNRHGRLQLRIRRAEPITEKHLQTRLATPRPHPGTQRSRKGSCLLPRMT